MATRRVYATVADYRDYLEDPSATVAARLLRRASDMVDAVTNGKQFPADEDGMPTDTGDREAFREAVCAQVEWFTSRGNVSGMTTEEDGLASLSIPGLSWSRDKTAEKSTDLCRAAYDVLDAAGLTGTDVRTTGGGR